MIPYARIYETEENARNAVSLLAQEGFPDDAVRLVTPTPGEEEETIDAAVRDGYLPGRFLSLGIQGLREGRSIVGVKAAFGFGQTAVATMERAGPVDSGRLPSYIVRNPSPFSDFLGIPVLSRVRPKPTLARSDFALFGFAQLINRPAPLSSLFGLPTLTRTGTRRREWRRSFGFPLLIRSAAPLSSLFRIPTLTRTGTRRREWTRSFGFPLLSKNPAPLSSLLGIPTLIGTDDDD